MAHVILEGNWGKFGEPQHLGNDPAEPDDEVPWHEKVIDIYLSDTSEHSGSLQPSAES